MVTDREACLLRLRSPDARRELGERVRSLTEPDIADPSPSVCLSIDMSEWIESSRREAEQAAETARTARTRFDAMVDEGSPAGDSEGD